MKPQTHANQRILSSPAILAAEAIALQTFEVTATREKLELRSPDDCASSSGKRKTEKMERSLLQDQLPISGKFEPVELVTVTNEQFTLSVQ